MPQAITDVAEFRAHRAWGARDLIDIDGVSVRLHWTDQPYKWHINDGAEAFVVLDGEIDMHFTRDGKVECVRLKPSDIFLADIGDQHVAHPVGEARILVVERKGSV